MPLTLPPLRLTGASVLRDGRMQARTLGLAGGRIAIGAFPAVDLAGYLVLPGILDLGLDLTVVGRTDPIAAERAAAARGVTTAWAILPWDTTFGRTPGLPRRPLIDMRAQLRPDLDRMLPGPEMLAEVQRRRVGAVLYHSLADGLARRPELPRRLCRLAEAFDAAGVIHGSIGDPDGETREFWSMLGAKLCAAPGAFQAASLARAVGDPVLAEIGAARVPAATLLRARRCDALIPGADTPDLAAAALALAPSLPGGLPAAWALVSEAPARIMRLPDRGTFAPGRRADIAVIHAASGRVEATIAAGRLVHVDGAAADRFGPALGPARSFAAE